MNLARCQTLPLHCDLDNEKIPRVFICSIELTKQLLRKPFHILIFRAPKQYDNQYQFWNLHFMHVILEVSYNTYIHCKLQCEYSYPSVCSHACKCMCVLECIIIYMGVDTYSYVKTCNEYVILHMFVMINSHRPSFFFYSIVFFLFVLIPRTCDSNISLQTSRNDRKMSTCQTPRCVRGAQKRKTSHLCGHVILCGTCVTLIL